MTGDQSSFEGGCLCGAVRYRASAPPVRGVLCHCTMCRKHSGAPALAFVHFPVESFEWVGAVPERYRSSRYAERGFCPDCGSRLWHQPDGPSQTLTVKAGSLDDPIDLADAIHIWTTRKLPGVIIPDDAEQWPEEPG